MLPPKSLLYLFLDPKSHQGLQHGMWLLCFIWLMRFIWSRTAPSLFFFFLMTFYFHSIQALENAPKQCFPYAILYKPQVILFLNRYEFQHACYLFKKKILFFEVWVHSRLQQASFGCSLEEAISWWALNRKGFPIMTTFSRCKIYSGYQMSGILFILKVNCFPLVCLY